MSFIKRLLPAILFLYATLATAQVGKLLPADEAARNPEFFAFLAHLQAAVARHDAAAVLAAVDPKIRTSFGTGGGIEEFRKKWNLSAANSPLWDKLGTVLAFGGAFGEGGSYSAPYVFARWPEKFDAFEHVAVLGTNVRVRAEKGTSGRILTALTFDVVRLASPGIDKDWVHVKLRDGRTGYISSRYVRSSVDYRALFNKTAAGWRMTAFIAGD
jgi:hypothetical protein